MNTFGLYLYALRAAEPRQLRARVLRPFRRRVFPRPTGAGRFAPLEPAFWRSGAFAATDEVALDGAVRLLGKEIPFPPSDWLLPGEPRLRRFHLHYGDEVLGWTRRGETAPAQMALDAWIGGNPPRADDAWHPYPLSTRIGNWVAALSIAPELATGAVVDSLRRQLAHLERNVEDDVLGNHVVRNARALVLGGRALGRSEAVEKGRALLRREVPVQILADGGHYERSPVYHLLVLRDLLEARNAGGLDWLDEPIERMERFAAALARPDGHPALFNDGWLDLAPVLPLPAPPEGLAVFPDTGYAVVREGGIWLGFDCGPPAPAFLPAHAHADALSFQLWVDGQPVAVDPGTYTYEPVADRDYARSTRSHSTISIDGADQFELWSAFRTGPLPDVRLHTAGNRGLEASVTWSGGIRHVRSVRWNGAGLDVDDLVEGHGRHRIESRLVRAPASVGNPVEVTGSRGAPAVEQGWSSEHFGERSPTDVLLVTSEAELPIETGWRVGDVE